jgi:hypothetical protein
VSDHHANGAAQFALKAHGVWRRAWLTVPHESADNFDQLMLVSRTSTQLKIDKDVVRDGVMCSASRYRPESRKRSA